MIKTILFSVSFFVTASSHAWSILDEGRNAEAKKARLVVEMDQAVQERDNQKYLAARAEYVPFLIGQYNFAPADLGTEYMQGSDYVESFMTLSNMQAPQTGKQLCEILKTPYGVNQFLANEENRMGLLNEPGTFGTGICWWHTSLTRASAMLAVYQPDLPKPTNKEAAQILDALIEMKTVVTIPGFHNWRGFTMVFSNLVESKLSAWQRREVVSFGWVRGLKGTSSGNAQDLRANLERADLEFRLYRKPVYMMLQFAGPASHAWLILDIKQTETGYTLYLLDSANKAVTRWEYKWGQEHMRYEKGRPFIPYIQPKERQDLFQIQSVTDQFCRQYQ